MFLKRDTITFGPGKGGPMQTSRQYTFPAKVTSASAVMTGFDTEYTSGDHHLGRVKVELDVAISGATVTVTAHLELRDFSGNWDDPYAGFIEFLVFAETTAKLPVVKEKAA